MAKVNQRILSIPERSVQWTVHMLEHYNHHPDTPSDTRWSGAKDNSLLSLNRRRKHGSVVLARPATLTETYVPIILSCPWPLLVNYILNYDQNSAAMIMQAMIMLLVHIYPPLTPVWSIVYFPSIILLTGQLITGLITTGNFSTDKLVKLRFGIEAQAVLQWDSS